MSESSIRGEYMNELGFSLNGDPSRRAGPAGPALCLLQYGAAVGRIITLVTAATVAFFVYGVAVENTAVYYYVPFTIVLIVLIGLLHRSARFTEVTLWMLVAIAIGNLAGGVLLVSGAPLYELDLIGSIRYDKVYHAVASGIAVWASFDALETWVGERRSALLVAAFLMAVGAGALVEVIEYIGSLIRENTIVGDYSNNAQDLIANTVGAGVGTAVVWRLHITASLRGEEGRR